MPPRQVHPGVTKVPAQAIDTNPRKGWHALASLRVGIIPVPVFAALVALVLGLDFAGEIKPDIPTMAAVLAVGGFGCAELGHRLPVLRSIGAAAILATFVPSALAYYGVIPSGMQKAIGEFTRSTNFLYVFIACIIVGSILGMNRRILVRGFLRILPPLAAGTVMAGLVGTAVGMLLGLGAYHTFFFIVVPIMAGGVGEGAIPLSVGYAAILGRDQGEMFALVLPPIMLGSLTAIILSGILDHVGARRPDLTGNGRLERDAAELPEVSDKAARGGDASEFDPADVVAAALTAIGYYLLGVLCFHWFGLPAPVAMLFLTVLAKLLAAVPKRLERGATVVYRLVRTGLTYPLLFAVGVAMTPWDKLVSAVTVPNLVTIVATVATLMATGAFVGRHCGLHPIETAIVNACHSVQGGTGDVAILTAANRLQLMPFAQIATRIGGAITLTLTLVLLAHMG